MIRQQRPIESVRQPVRLAVPVSGGGRPIESVRQPVRLAVPVSGGGGYTCAPPRGSPRWVRDSSRLHRQIDSCTRQSVPRTFTTSSRAER